MDAPRFPTPAPRHRAGAKAQSFSSLFNSQQPSGVDISLVPQKSIWLHGAK